MKRLLYERLAQLVAISAINKDTRSISELCIKEQCLQIRFSDYVKSQVHLNIVEDLCHRNISEYAKALYYLQGHGAYIKQALQVLRYFYYDMSKFLINNSYNVMLDLVVDFQLEEKEIDFLPIKQDYLHVVENPQDLNALRSFKYAWIIDEVCDKEDALVKADSYVLAAILQEFSKSEQIYKLKLRGIV